MSCPTPYLGKAFNHIITNSFAFTQHMIRAMQDIILITLANLVAEKWSLI